MKNEINSDLMSSIAQQIDEKIKCMRCWKNNI